VEKEYNRMTLISQLRIYSWSHSFGWGLCCCCLSREWWLWYFLELEMDGGDGYYFWSQNIKHK